MPTIPLGDYLFQRLRQLGVQHIFGVPGDFNLKLLDYIDDVDGLDWVGNCNELNASYAADGYARMTGLPGCFVTTFGVGEMSAMNGVSGACAESVPLLHIVGATPRYAQEQHLIMHHSPAPNGEFGLEGNNHHDYLKSAAPFNSAAEVLWDPYLMPDQIDEVIRTVYRLNKPGSLYIPIDTISLEVDDTNLNQPIVRDVPVHPLTTEVVEKILEAYKAAKNPLVLLDGCSTRWFSQKEIADIVERTGSWSAVTLMGRGSICEQHPSFLGVYTGHVERDVCKAVEKDADFVLNIGPVITDFNTGAFSRDIPQDKLIMLHSRWANVYGREYGGVNFKHVIERVLAELPAKPQADASRAKPVIHRWGEDLPLKGEIKQDILPRLIQEFLTPESTLIVETSTMQSNSANLVLPAAGTFWTQIFYASIGYALPSSFGAALGKEVIKADNKRVFVVEGDGSAQLTIQELGKIIQHKLPVTIFLMNNTGYEIERAIWGVNAEYNEISPNWQWSKLPEVMGAAPGTTESYQVSTAEELVALAHNKEFRESKKPQFVELLMPKHDVPQTLKQQTVLNAAISQYRVRQWQSKVGHK